MIRYVVGCLVVALVLFLLFVGLIFALVYFFAGEFVHWTQNSFQHMPGWLQNLIQSIQHQK